METTNPTLFKELEELLIKNHIRYEKYDEPLYISPDIYHILYEPKNLEQLKQVMKPSKVNLLYLSNHTNRATLTLMPFMEELGIPQYKSYEEEESADRSGWVLLYQEDNLRIYGPSTNWVM